MAANSRRLRPLLAVAVVLALVLLARGPSGAPQASAACADTVLVRTVKRYSLTSGSQVTHLDTCTAIAVPGRRFLLEALRPSASNPLDSARVSYGGVEYFGTHDVDASNVLLSRIITPKGADTLRVTLYGGAGAKLDLRVTHVPESRHQVASQSGFNSSNSTDKWYTRYFSLAEGVPATPHVMTLTNGYADLTGAARTHSPEVWLNSQQIVFADEVTRGRAFLTRNVTLEDLNTLEIKIRKNTAGSPTKTMSVKFYATDVTPPVLMVLAPSDSLVTRAAKVLASVQLADSQTGTRLWVDGAEKPLANGAWSDSLALPAQDGKTTFAFVGVNGACLTDTVRRTVIRDTQAPELVVSWPEEAVPPSVPADSAEISVSGTWVDSTWTVVRVDGDTLASGYSGPSPRTFSCRVPLDLGPNRIVIEAFDAAGNADTLVRYAYRTPTETSNLRQATNAALGVSDLSATEATSFRSAIQFLYTGNDPVQVGLADSTLMAAREAVISGRVFARDFGGLVNVTVSVLGHPEYGSTLTRVDGSFDLVVNGGSRLTLRFRKAGFLEAQRDVDVPTEDYVILDDLALIGQRARADSIHTASGAQAVVSRFESDANGDRKLTLLFAPATECSVTTSSGTQIYPDFHVRVKEFTVGADGEESMPAGLPPTTAYTYCVDLGVDEAAQQAGGDLLPPIVTFNQPVVAYVKEFLGMRVGSAMPSGYYDQRRAEWVASEDGTVVRVTSISGGHANFDTNGDGVPDSLAQLTALGITTTERQQVAQLFAAGDSLWRMRIQHFSPHDFNPNIAMLASSGSRLHANAQSLSQLVGAPEATCGCVIENENRVLGETIPIQGTPYALHYRSNRQPGDIAMRTLRIPLVGSPLPQDLRRIRIRVDVAGKRYAYDLNYGEFHANQVFTFDDWDGSDRYGRPIIGSVTATIRVGLEFIAAYATQSGTRNSFNQAADVPVGAGSTAEGERSVGRLIWTTQRVSIGAPSMASAGLGGWTITPHHYFDPSGRGTFWGGDGSFRYGYRNLPVVYRYAGTGLSSTGQSPPTEGSEVVIGTGGYHVTPYDLAFGRNDSLYFSDGSHQILCISPDKRWHRVAGTGSAGEPATEGGSAILSPIWDPRGIAVARDGTVYFVDLRIRKLFKVTPDGRIFTVAGTGVYPNTLPDVRKEDTLATAWQFKDPWGVALGPDGSVFVSDRGDHRVLRIDTRGHIRTYAGRLDGTAPNGDRRVEGKAVGLGLNSPSDMVTDPQGNLYVIEGSFANAAEEDVIWRIAPDGRRVVHTKGALMYASSLAYGPDGLLWMGHDWGTNGVYRVEEDGSRSLIAGGHVAGDNFDNEDGQFARGTQFRSVESVALDSRGALYLASLGTGAARGSGIHRISPELPGGAAGNIVFPSEDGRERYIFNGNGRHLRTEDAITGRLRYTFGYTSGRLASITDVMNARTTTIHRTAGEPATIEAPFGQLTTLTLDGNRFLSGVTNAKSESHAMEYDAGGLLKKFTNPRQNYWDYEYWPSDGRLKRDTDREAGGHLLGEATVTDTTLTVSRTTAGGRTTTYDIVQMLDGVRRRLVHRPAHGATTVEVEVDSMSATTPYGEVNWSKSATGVEAAERPARDPRFGWLAPVPASSVTRLPVSGRLRTVETTRSWDSNGRLFTETARLNGAEPPYTTVYDTLTKLLTLTTPEQRTSKVWLSDEGRPTQLEPGTQVDPVRLGYDASGRLTHLAQGARAWRYGYDGRGRLETVTDTLGRVSSYKYDLADRESLLTLPGDRVVRFRYDANGNLEGLTPPGGEEHAFTYTDVDLNEVYTPPTVAGIADPATRYSFNADRQLTDVLRPDGSQVRLRYNSTRGWLDSLSIARGRTTLTHDGPAGQLAAATSPDGVTSSYAWDGPVLIRERWSGAASGAVARTLNSAFAESTQTVVVGSDSSSVAGYTYDDDGLLTDVALAGVPVQTITRRDSDGLVTGTSVSAGGGTVTSTHGYNAYGELASLSYSWPGGGAFSQVLGRDSLGRITQVTETVDGATHVHGYHYDLAGRLDEVRRDGVLQRSYVYDSLPGNGNRTKEKDGSGAVLAIGSYDKQDRLTDYGGTAYEWMANGELARRIAPGPDTTRTTYDELGNLTGAHLPGVAGDSLTYVIDASNRRVGRLVNGQRTHTWLYANQLNVVAELDGIGELRHRYVYGTQAHVPDLLVHADTLYRLVTDHLGSVRALVRVRDGEAAQRIDYDAWGVRTLDTNPGWQSLGYAGGLTDTSTGLVRFGARDYEPEVGRWTDRDPSGLSESSSTYLYCSGAPVDRIDPNGRIPMDSDTPGLIDGPLFRNPLGFPSPHAWWKHTIAAGRIWCGTPADWIGDDLFGEGRRGRGKDGCAPYHHPLFFDDVDAVKVCGKWYRIRGWVCISGCNVVPLTDASYAGPPSPAERDKWSREFGDPNW